MVIFEVIVWNMDAGVLSDLWYDIDMIYLTAIGLTPSGSSTHLHTNNT